LHVFEIVSQRNGAQDVVSPFAATTAVRSGEHVLVAGTHAPLSQRKPAAHCESSPHEVAHEVASPHANGRHLHGVEM